MISCFETVAFSFDSFCTLRIEPLWRMAFARLIRRRNKMIHAKLNCACNESGKGERIIREARIPGICSEKGSPRVSVSFVTVEDFLRRERFILVGHKHYVVG